MLSSFKEFILEHNYNKVNTEFIVEGIDVDVRNKIVKLNPNHNNGVDFSLKNNPIEYELNLHNNKILVTSMLKRTLLGINRDGKVSDEWSKNSKYKDIDGNSFIYALKKINGWKLEISEEALESYTKHFLKLCKKLYRKYDTIIIVPSKYDINEKFANIICKYVGTNRIIKDYFRKRDKHTMLNQLDTDKLERELCYIGNAYNYKLFDSIMDEIKEAIYDKMESDYFEVKYIKKYIKYFGSYITQNNELIGDVYNDIEDKNVLILDDTISSGETISYCVDALLTTFNPKNIEVVTLLSPLENNLKKYRVLY